jgi:hypothetical protein
MCALANGQACRRHGQDSRCRDKRLEFGIGHPHQLIGGRPSTLRSPARETSQAKDAQAERASQGWTMQPCEKPGHSTPIIVRRLTRD